MSKVSRRDVPNSDAISVEFSDIVSGVQSSQVRPKKGQQSPSPNPKSKRMSLAVQLKQEHSLEDYLKSLSSDEREIFHILKELYTETRKELIRVLFLGLKGAKESTIKAQRQKESQKRMQSVDKYELDEDQQIISTLRSH